MTENLAHALLLGIAGSALVYFAWQETAWRSRLFIVAVAIASLGFAGWYVLKAF